MYYYDRIAKSILQDTNIKSESKEHTLVELQEVYEYAEKYLELRKRIRNDKVFDNTIGDTLTMIDYSNTNYNRYSIRDIAQYQDKDNTLIEILIQQNNILIDLLKEKY